MHDGVQHGPHYRDVKAKSHYRYVHKFYHDQWNENIYHDNFLFTSSHSKLIAFFMIDNVTCPIDLITIPQSSCIGYNKNEGVM